MRCCELWVDGWVGGTYVRAAGHPVSFERFVEEVRGWVGGWVGG